MNPEQWRDELVRLAMEAYDRSKPPGLYLEDRERFLEAIRERMSQAATAIASLDSPEVCFCGELAAKSPALCRKHLKEHGR